MVPSVGLPALRPALGRCDRIERDERAVARPAGGRHGSAVARPDLGLRGDALRVQPAHPEEVGAPERVVDLAVPFATPKQP